MRKASGEYLKPFAQDDLFEPTILARQLAIFEEKKGIALVSCARRLVDDDGCETEILREYNEDKVLDYQDVLKENLLKLRNGIGEPRLVCFRVHI